MIHLLILVVHLIFEWHIDWCGSKVWVYTIHMSKEVRQHEQNLMTIVGLVVNIMWKNLCDHLMGTSNLQFDNDPIFISDPKIIRKVSTALIWIR